MDKPVSSARRSSRIRNAAESDAEADFQAFVAPSPRPLSEKALGKRPQATPRIPAPSIAPAPAPDAAARKAATRVLPSRSSRKSQGTLMVDELLLDYEQRSEAAKSSLAPSTSFLLTTDASVVPPPRDLDDASQPKRAPSRTVRPTLPPEQSDEPDFVQLPPAAAVGSRLRVRETDDAAADTSDQAYLVRHRRFEALEKRQRLREKEKIQHERYKLKERIEQLRAMPAHAFVKDHPASQPNGEPAVDGERIRRELLREAEELERRYDLLLSTNHRDHGAAADEHLRPPPSLTIKVRLGSHSHSNGTRTPPHEHHQNHHPFTSSNLHHTTTTSASSSSRPANGSSRAGRVARFNAASPSPSPEQTERASKRPRRESHSSSAREHRSRERSSGPALSYAELESHGQIPAGYVPDILRVAAPTNASRTNLRTSLPFGVKVPGIVEDQYDFELPPDILPQHPSEYLGGTAVDEVSDGGPPGHDDEEEAPTTEGDVVPSDEETLGLVSAALDDD